MKYRILVVIILVILSMGFIYLNTRNKSSWTHFSDAPSIPVRSEHVIRYPVIPLLKDELPKDELSQSLSQASGETHVLALEVIMNWIKNQHILTEVDRDTLLDYLAQSKPETLGVGEWEERVNELLNLLRCQPEGVPGLADLLIHMVTNDSDPVMRMYALQHLAMWIPDEPVADNRIAMVDLLQRLAQTSGDPLAGSAVLFLNDLANQSGNLVDTIVADEIIERAALRIVDDGLSSPDVRITALHTCAARGMQNSAPAARLIAADTSMMIPLRKAAIFTLGELGNAEDREMLESLATSNPALAAATAPALKKLKL